MVTKKLHQEIIPVWTALVLESDNGPVLMAKVSQNSTKVLNSNWKLHCVCRPPGSGQIEMTREMELFGRLAKLILEIGQKLGRPPPFSLLRPDALLPRGGFHLLK